MSPQSLNLSQLAGEEKLLLARLEDILRIAAEGGRPRFSSFLNERQALIASELARQHYIDSILLYGGFEGAQRRVFGAFPAYEEPADDLFPITAVTIRLPKGAAPSHRDVLGSLMSLRITRESIGDILISDRRCDVFALDTVASLIVEELTKIGGYGVKCETGAAVDYASTASYKEIRGTVSSLRVDSVVSLLTNLAREKSAGLIRAEQVQCNYQTASSVSAPIAPGDIITVRGYGKYIVDEIGNPTKKGRLPLRCRKYC